MVAWGLFFGTISKCWFGQKLFGIDLHKMQALWKPWRFVMAFVLLLDVLKVSIESDAQDVVRMLNEAKFSRADLASLSVSTEKQMCTRAPIFNLATLSIPTEKQMKRHTSVPNRLVRIVEDVSW